MDLTHVEASRANLLIQPSAELLQAEAAELFFGDTRFRPDPLMVADMIHQGLTEDTIVAAGRMKGLRRPVMDLTLRELEVGLPYYQQICDKLAADHGDQTLLFASRDAEVLYDDFAITHPEVKSHLLPASTDLWVSRGMLTQKLAAPFLERYGLSPDAVNDSDKKYVVVDSGFRGTVGELLDRHLQRLFGVSMRAVGRLAIKLVSAKSTGLGRPILELPDAVTTAWPKYDRLVGKDDYTIFRSNYFRSAYGTTFGLAVGMQLMPRYHASYADLAEIDGRVVALPASAKPTKKPDKYESVNSSIINPLAAAIVQYRVVKAALERVGQGPFPVSETSAQMSWLGRIATLLPVGLGPRVK